MPRTPARPPTSSAALPGTSARPLSSSAPLPRTTARPPRSSSRLTWTCPRPPCSPPRRVGGDEDVVVTGARQRAAAEAGGALEVAGDASAALGVQADPRGLVQLRAAEVAAPLEGSQLAELHREDV